MKHPIMILATVVGLVSGAAAQLQPVVSNVHSSQRAGTKFVDITYDLAYGGGPVTVWVDVSNDGGRSYIVPAKTFSGHIGQGVSPGTNRAMSWDAAADFDGMLAEQMRVRVTARAGSVPVPPPYMVFIPGGHFFMGEWTNGNSSSACQIYVSPMFMDRYEVWGTLFNEVKDWAAEIGYDLPNFSNSTQPVSSGHWYDAVKWCNARSEHEGLTPVYYTDEAHTAVYRSGEVDLTNAMAKWDANGYRLPTEAEWEKAARGGLSGKIYPWGDTIDTSMANYGGTSNGAAWRAVYSTRTPVGYFNGDQLGGGGDMANGYGLYDMVGNEKEWCWDRSGGGISAGSDPRGPDSGSRRIVRGGSYSGVTQAKCAYRDSAPANYADYSNNYSGFRCVRGL